jgi:hypothetical protein
MASLAQSGKLMREQSIEADRRVRVNCFLQLLHDSDAINDTVRMNIRESPDYGIKRERIHTIQ